MANDTVLIKYVADTAQLEKELNQVEAEMLGVDKASKKTSDTIQKGAKKSAQELDKVNKEVKGLGSAMGDLANQLPFAGQAQQILQMGSALTGVTKATTQGSTAMKIFKFALASTGIGLLIVGIASLISYFKKTDEGAVKLAGIFKAVEIVTANLFDVFIDIGQAVVKAFSSFENFKQGLLDLGNVIKDNIFNRFKGFIVLMEAVNLAIDQDFSGASIKFSDAMIQIGTGVTDASKKFQKFAKDVDAASAEGQRLAKAFDDLEDAERVQGVTLAKNAVLLTKLLVQQKNRNLSGVERIAILKEASAIEEKGFKETLRLAELKLKLIKEDIKATQQKIGLTDEEADRIAEQEKVIAGLREGSVQLQEKIENRLTVAQEENFKEQIDLLNDNLKLKEIANKEALLSGLITQEEFNKKEIEATIDTLEQQANFTKIAGKNDADIQLQILDLKLKLQSEGNKKLLDSEQKYYEIQNQNITDEAEVTKQLLISTQLDLIEAKKLTEKEASIQLLQFDNDVIKRRQALAIEAGQDTLKFEEEQLKKENEIKKALYDKDVENKKKADEQKKAIIIAGLNILAEVASELASRGFEARKEAINKELQLVQDKTDKETAINQGQLDKGIISQAQFNARQERLDKKKRDAEAIAKRKQFEADKEAAIVQATISSLLAFVVSLASAPLPGSLIPAGIALATGLVQVALIASKPTPKFAKGGMIDGKSHTQGGVHIEAEGGEYIINKAQTSKNKDVLNAINKGMFDQYVHNNYVLPQLKSNIINAKENSNKTNQKLLESLVMNGLVDTSNLERLTRKNKTVSIDNGNEIASTIASRINSKSYVK